MSKKRLYIMLEEDDVYKMKIIALKKKKSLTSILSELAKEYIDKNYDILKNEGVKNVE